MNTIQFVFDSYLELTVEDSERRRRGSSITYELVDLIPSTSLPSMMDNFWKSENNKRKLINAAYKYYIDNLGTCAFNVVCSGYIDQNGDIYPAMHCSGTHVRVLIELQE